MPNDPTRMLRALFDDNPMAIVVADTDRRIVAVNQSFTRMFGYQPEEVLGEKTQILYAEAQDFAEKAGGTFQEAGGRRAFLYLRFRDKAARIFPARMVATKLHDADGRVYGFAGTIEDLSERLGPASDPTEMERAEAERSFRETLYRRTPAMMHSIGPDGRLVAVSDAWLDRLGYTRPDVLGRRSVEFLTPESQAKAAGVLEDFWKTGRCTRVPYVFVAKDGAKVEVELSAIVDTSSGEKRTMAVMDDVTLRNRTLRLLEDRNEKLRQYARVVSHDLRAPLRQICMLAELASEDLTEGRPDAVETQLHSIRTRAAMLSEMVSSLLDFSSAAETGVAAREFELDVLVQTILDDYVAVLAERGGRIEAAPLPRVFADPGLIERVLDNLISNAIKFVPTGTAPDIRINAAETPQEWTISVADTGLGVPEGLRERIFEPLTRIHGPEDFPGTGIGLALCRKIVDAHGGRIWAEGRPGSDIGGGSVFHFTLPRRSGPAISDRRAS